MSTQHEYCKPMSAAGRRRLGGLPAGKVTPVWELHGAEDRRRGREEERRRGRQEDRRTGLSSTARHAQPFQSRPAQREQAFPVPRRVPGTGIPSVPAGVVGRAFLAVWGRVFRHSLCRSPAVRWGQASPARMPTPGRCCRAPWGQVAPAGRGERTGAPGAAWYVGKVPPRWGWCFWPGWVMPGWGGMEVGAGGTAVLGLSVCWHQGWPDVGWAGVKWDGLERCWVGWHDVGKVCLLWGRLIFCGAGWCDVGQVDMMWGRLA